MKNNVLFSVVTVTLNASETIGRTVQSVLSQSYKNFEYIVIDGNSSDDTLKIVNENANGNSTRVIVVSESDEGIYDAMNKAANIANGEYIFFLGSGDTFVDEFVLNNMEKAINQNSFPDIVYGDVIYSTDNDNRHMRFGSRKKMSLLNIAFQRYICHQAVFAKRNLFSVRKFDLSYKYMADQDWFVYWMRENANICAIPLIIANYNLLGVSSSVAYSGDGYYESDLLAERACPILAKMQQPIKRLIRNARYMKKGKSD